MTELSHAAEAAVGTVIRELRIQRNLSQGTVAAQVYAGQPTLSRLERGGGSTLTLLSEVLVVLNVGWDEFGQAVQSRITGLPVAEPTPSLSLIDRVKQLAAHYNVYGFPVNDEHTAEGYRREVLARRLVESYHGGTLDPAIRILLETEAPNWVWALPRRIPQRRQSYRQMWNEQATLAAEILTDARASNRELPPELHQALSARANHPTAGPSALAEQCGIPVSTFRSRLAHAFTDYHAVQRSEHADHSPATTDHDSE